MTTTDDAAVWQAVRSYALSLPGAAEEFPWGQSVVKAARKIFVFLGPANSPEMGPANSPEPLTVTVKLRDADVHQHALSLVGSRPSGYGLGRSGWVSLTLTQLAVTDAELLSEWVEESYRAVVPRRLVAELDAAGAPSRPPAVPSS